MALDTDIAAALPATATPTEKLYAIAVQDARSIQMARNAIDQTKATEFSQFVDVQQKTAEGLLDPQAEVRLAIVRAIAANYMKPTTTSTQQAYIDADANLDARKLEAAVKELELIVAGTPLTVKTAP